MPGRAYFNSKFDKNLLLGLFDKMGRAINCAFVWVMTAESEKLFQRGGKLNSSGNRCMSGICNIGT